MLLLFYCASNDENEIATGPRRTMVRKFMIMLSDHYSFCIVSCGGASAWEAFFNTCVSWDKDQWQQYLNHGTCTFRKKVLKSLSESLFQGFESAKPPFPSPFTLASTIELRRSSSFCTDGNDDE